MRVKTKMEAGGREVGRISSPISVVRICSAARHDSKVTARPCGPSGLRGEDDIEVFTERCVFDCYSKTLVCIDVI